jgi:cardiolipin synthase
MDNRHPSRTVAWIMALIFIPVIGVVLYVMTGQNYRRKKLFSRKGLHDYERLEIQSAIQLKGLPDIDFYLNDEDIKEKADLIELLLKNSNAVIASNESVTILNDGEETFISIFEALEKAKHYIHVEYYILKLDEIGTKLFDILKRKAAEGVEVKVIYDSVGSMGMKYSKKREIRASGIQLESFLRIYFPLFSSRSNYRNHRKIVVVDGKIGFTGGINVADNYINKPDSDSYWRDTFVRIEGNSVYALNAVFSADWYFITKQHSQSKPPKTMKLKDKGNYTQIISGCPDSDWKVILQFYFAAISTAKKSVYITTPYFIPNEEVISAIRIAALRGLDVRIILPEITDSKITKWCSESYLGSLIQAGVKIYLYQPGFVHSKVIIIDGVVSSVGTANMDYRSMDTNFEVNAVFYEKKIASELTEFFFRDIEDCELLTFEDWKNRPIHKKVLSSITRLLAPAL